VASYRVNEKAVARARGLIESRQYVLNSDWGRCSRGQLRKTHTSPLTRGRSTANGIWVSPKDLPRTPKARYAFVYGDFRRIHRTGLIACHYRAAEWRHKEIELAAHELLQLLDESSA
jgi:hypothetical protein